MDDQNKVIVDPPSDPLDLPPHLATIAESYFGETPQRRRDALQAPHLSTLPVVPHIH